MDSWLYLWLFVWLSSPEDLFVVLLGSVQDSFYVDTFGFMTCCGNVPSLSDFFFFFFFFVTANRIKGL